MKARFSLLLLFTLLLTACGGAITVATPEEIEAYPEAEGAMRTWQGIVDSVEAKDCETLLTYTRLTLNVEGDACPDIYAYFEDEVPVVDWSRTDWSTSGGKAKIYEKDGGSITSFIHNEKDDSWRTDEKFWE